MADNSIPRFKNATLDEIQQSLGITNFSGEFDWNHTIGGLIIQGGRISDNAGDGGDVVFNVTYPKQVLFVVAFPINSTGNQNVSGLEITLSGFRIYNNHGNPIKYNWLAIGI